MLATHHHSFPSPQKSGTPPGGRFERQLVYADFDFMTSDTRWCRTSSRLANRSTSSKRLPDISRRMLEHYSHIRLKAKKVALDRLDGSTKDASIKRAK